MAIAAPDLTWSAAPEMGTSDQVSTSDVEDEQDDAPSNVEPELEEDREFLFATVLLTPPVRHANGLARHCELLGAPPGEHVQRATPPPEV